MTARRAPGRRADDAASARPARELLTPDEVAAELRVTTKTLRNWRYLDRNAPAHRRLGPAHVMVGGRARYTRAALDAYVTR